jgi:hypothetical protein
MHRRECQENDSVKNREKPPLRAVHKMGIAIIAVPVAWFLAFLPELFVPSIRPGMKFITFGISYAVGCYFWKWLLFDRSSEMQRKLPISSREHRENRKRFYDELPR